MTKPSKILVIIPAYNEEATIASVIGDIKKHVPEAGIVVVDDGSTDSTASVAAAAGVTVLRQPFNMGIGATVQTGYKYARMNGYDVAVQVDADGQHKASEIRRVVEPVIAGKAHLVIGSRFLGVGDYKPSIARGIGIRIFSSIVSAATGSRVTDTTSGFRAAGREAIEFFSRSYPDDYPEVESLVLLHKKGLSIMETPVKMAERAGGESSITPARSAYYMVKVILAIGVDLMKKVD